MEVGGRGGVGVEVEVIIDYDNRRMVESWRDGVVARERERA